MAKLAGAIRIRKPYPKPGAIYVDLIGRPHPSIFGLYVITIYMPVRMTLFLMQNPRDLSISEFVVPIAHGPNLGAANIQTIWRGWFSEAEKE
jgi:hypothetical protein